MGSEKGSQAGEDGMRLVTVPGPFDLARTAAPVWWAKRRWPNIDWHLQALTWVGFEDGVVVDRMVRQLDECTLAVTGSADAGRDGDWLARILGTEASCPEFSDPVIAGLAEAHRGFRPWANGSLFDGTISAIVGQSISVAAAAVTEQRLFALFNPARELAGRSFWPAPLPEQLAAASVETIRQCGVTWQRAAALAEVGRAFAAGEIRNVHPGEGDAAVEAKKLLAIPGVGRWTERSALLWGLAEPDAHPTGDVALLRCARRHYGNLERLKDLDELSEQWRPARAWAARLLWLDSLGWDRDG